MSRFIIEKVTHLRYVGRLFCSRVLLRYARVPLTLETFLVTYSHSFSLKILHRLFSGRYFASGVSEEDFADRPNYNSLRLKG